MDTGDLNLPAYKYQLEQVENSFRFVSFRHKQKQLLFTLCFLQVELALKAKPDDPELLKLKTDLEVNRRLVFVFR